MPPVNFSALSLQYTFIFSILIAYMFLPLPLSAQQSSLCQISKVNTPTNIRSDDKIEVNADKFETGGQRFIFSGNVQLSQQNQFIVADRITLDRSNDQISASGNILFSDTDFIITANQLQLDQTQNKLDLFQTNFELIQSQGRGSADRITRFGQQSELTQVRYNTCEPGDESWLLTGDKLDINQQNGLGTMQHATLEFKGVPFFYLPWFRFPIDDRRMSGILTPAINYSEDHGLNLELPIYWNLAENYDATITPIWFEQRGLQLNTEARYLFQRQYGELFLSGLDDRSTDSDRWFGLWTHSASLPFESSAEILYQKVSDDEFLDDFSHVNAIRSSPDFLQRKLSISRNFGLWQSQVKWQDYQTIDADKSISSRPYQRLPELTLSRRYISESSDLQLNLPIEWVQFKREQSITGERFHTLPALSLPSYASWYLFHPKLELALSQYDLDNNTAGNPDRISRSIPLISLDTALNFERIFSDSGLLQSFQPRLYLLYVPFEEQSDIPDFDTSLLSETYSSLFKSNRFSGSDRIGDSQQISVGLNTTIFNPESGRKLLDASIGQSYYLEDRRVSLGTAIDERSRSNLINEIKFSPLVNLSFTSKLIFNQDTDNFEQKNLSAQLIHKGSVFNLASHFTEDRLNQVSFSTAYRLNRQWNLFAKYHQSRFHDAPVDHLLGFSYETCCWGLKMLAREFSDDDFEQQDRSIYFELTLKGLGQSGKRINQHLENAILGYNSKF